MLSRRRPSVQGKKGEVKIGKWRKAAAGPFSNNVRHLRHFFGLNGQPEPEAPSSAGRRVEDYQLAVLRWPHMSSERADCAGRVLRTSDASRIASDGPDPRSDSRILMAIITYLTVLLYCFPVCYNYRLHTSPSSGCLSNEMHVATDMAQFTAPSTIGNMNPACTWCLRLHIYRTTTCAKAHES